MSSSVPELRAGGRMEEKAEKGKVMGAFLQIFLDNMSSNV
jgi:hypothetical protein